MSPAEALNTIAAQNPGSVLILSEHGRRLLLTAGSIGPDLSLEHINSLLDQAKKFVLDQIMTPADVVTPGSGVALGEAPRGQGL